MTRKVIIFLMIVIVLISSGCSYRRISPPDNNQGKQGNIPKEDKLAKSKKEAVEENINGFTLEDDLKITDLTEMEEENRVSALGQAERNRLLGKIGSKSMNTVLEEYTTTLPTTINSTLQYREYEMAYDYFLITAEEGGKVHESPTPNSEIVAEVANLDKVSLLQRVDGVEANGSNIWYRVAFKNGDGLKEGYLSSATGTPRSFRFDSMEAAVNKLKQLLAQGPLNFISNYKNQNGTPPQIGEESIDQYGYRFYHSAAAYSEASTESEFRYIPDGMLVRIINETEEFYHVNVPDFEGDFYVQKQYINRENTLTDLRKVVVVDRDQQNQASFEVVEGGLNLVSYVLSTTGFKGEFSFVTTLGNFKVIEKRERFEYLQNGTQEIAGYAPYALRFTGGAYIHGVPVAYKEENGEKVDPGIIEYLHTIGTFPRSNMCVRNFSSHAEFLYNWMDSQNGAVIIID